MMTRAALGLALVIGLASSSARADRAIEPPMTPQETVAAVRTERLAALDTAAKCSDRASVWRLWCPATKFATGTAPALPKGKVLLGLTIELQSGADAATALSDKVGLVVVAFDKTGKAKLMDITPTEPGESAMIADAVMQVAAVMKGKAKSITLNPDLAAYINTRTGEYATKRVDGAWAWQGKNPTQLRKVGSTWVAIEVAQGANGSGIWASVLTSAWK